MLTFRPTRSFLITPKNNQEYNREKGGVIVTSSIESAKDVNRFGIIKKTPLYYDGDLVEGDEVVLHHNVFRSYYDMKGYERKSKEYFKDNLYLVDESKIYLVKRKKGYLSFDDYCFVSPKGEENLEVSLGSYELHKGTVKFVNPNIINQGIEEGMEVGYTKDSEYEFEIEGELLYRMKRKDICVKFF
jgi:hypothetical protein